MFEKSIKTVTITDVKIYRGLLGQLLTGVCFTETYKGAPVRFKEIPGCVPFIVGESVKVEKIGKGIYAGYRFCEVES